MIAWITAISTVASVCADSPAREEREKRFMASLDGLSEQEKADRIAERDRAHEAFIQEMRDERRHREIVDAIRESGGGPSMGQLLFGGIFLSSLFNKS